MKSSMVNNVGHRSGVPAISGPATGLDRAARCLTDRHCAGCWNESAGRLFACQGIIDMKKLIVPKFPTESAEAEWWDNHMDVVEGNLIEAIQEGTASRGTEQRVLREARELKSVTIQMPRADVNRAQRLSAKQGLSSETYLQTLLHEALQSEESGDSTRDES